MRPRTVSACNECCRTGRTSKLAYFIQQILVFRHGATIVSYSSILQNEVREKSTGLSEFEGNK